MRIDAWRCLGIAILAFHLAGCTSRNAVQPPDVAGAGLPVTQLTSERERTQLGQITAERARADARDGYRIGPDDLLEIGIPDLLPVQGRAVAVARGLNLPSVAEAPVTDQGFRVSSRGDIALPYLGRIPVEGRTTAEVEDLLIQRLHATDILRKAQVSVRLVEYRSGVVAVMGSVERPGLYPITRPGATVADLIWAAGGPGKDAGRLVWFGPEGSTEPLRVDLETLLQPHGAAALSMNPRVRAGDVVTVAPAGQVLVDGWVEKPGSYSVTRGLTLVGAVAAAGGTQFAADERRVRVRRSIGPSEQRTFDIDLGATSTGEAPDFPLLDGDVVNVPVSVPRLVPWGVWQVARELIHVGGSIALF